MAYIVYILTNKRHGTLYVGITSDLKRRIVEHRLGIVDGFSKKYDLKLLVYFEQFQYVNDAIYREKQLKKWNREWKIDLIEKRNPEWFDLFNDIFGSIDEEYVDYISKQIENSKK